MESAKKDSKMTILEYCDVYEGLSCVIAGGQDGADIAGLAAAHASGVQTGGHCPRFWRTSSGPNLELKEKYGLIETEATNYNKRTGLNVQNADGTIRFASNFGTAGEILTLKYIQHFKKPYYDVLLPLQKDDYLTTVNKICDWILVNQISILNVAGNRDHNTRYGNHYHDTFSVLMHVFKKLEILQKLKRQQ